MLASLRRANTGNAMSLRGRACIVGAYEHPTRKAPDRSTAQLHAEVAWGALQDAGLSKDDIDGYFCAGDAPGMGPLSMAEYLGLDRLSHVDGTDIGGSSYIAHVAHRAHRIGARDGAPHRRLELVVGHERVLRPRRGTGCLALAARTAGQRDQRDIAAA